MHFSCSVDLETDARIQETILREFKHKTLLCIAHRLRTIINYQRIVVMDQGRIAVRHTIHKFDIIVLIPWPPTCIQEFDTPLNLFDQKGGIFRSMCETSQITRKDIEAAWEAARWGTSG